jgi:hypothetical protein
MEHLTSPRDEAEIYDEALDRLVDTRNCSYDEAREILGTPPYELIETTTLVSLRAVGAAASRSARPGRRRRNGNGPQFGEEEVYAGDQPLYYRSYVQLSIINTRGHSEALEALAAAQVAKTAQ